MAFRKVGGHHIYKAGHVADSCVPSQFNPTYWTDGRQVSVGSSLVGTAFAQRAIWKHQHPHDCKAAKYILWNPTRHGIGSNYHIMGGALAYGLALGRVLILMDDLDHPYYDPQYCGDREPSFHTCYFEPISNCSLKDARAVLGVEALNYDGLTTVQLLDADRPDEKVVKILQGPQHPHFYPPLFSTFLETSPINPDKFYYWWRAQSLAFLLRPNNRTLDELRDRKGRMYPWTIERGTISCHIRHGDKFLEYRPTDDRAYVKALEEVLALDGQRALKRHVFLLTDDPKSVRYFSKLQNWNVTYTSVPRSEEHTVPIERALKHGRANELLHSLVDLDLALECDAWVGTLTSNWSRLIDELRSTIRCKANAVYWDAAQANPPSELEYR